MLRRTPNGRDSPPPHRRRHPLEDDLQAAHRRGAGVGLADAGAVDPGTGGRRAPRGDAESGGGLARGSRLGALGVGRADLRRADGQPGRVRLADVDVNRRPGGVRDVARHRNRTSAARPAAGVAAAGDRRNREGRRALRPWRLGAALRPVRDLRRRGQPAGVDPDALSGGRGEGDDRVAAGVRAQGQARQGGADDHGRAARDLRLRRRQRADPGDGRGVRVHAADDHEGAGRAAAGAGCRAVRLRAGDRLHRLEHLRDRDGADRVGQHRADRRGDLPRVSPGGELPDLAVGLRRSPQAVERRGDSGVRDRR